MPTGKAQRRNNAENHHVAQAVQRGAESRAGFQPACRAAVQRIEDSRQHDQPDRAFPAPVEGETQRGESGNKPGYRQHVRQARTARPSGSVSCCGAGAIIAALLFRLGKPPERSARTVSPATVRWPASTSTGVSAGSHKSTRLPKRMIPNCWPMASSSPTPIPAECAAPPNRQSGRCRPSVRSRLHHDILALVFLGSLVEAGVEEFAGMVVRIDDPARDGRAVHMDIKHVHKNRDATPLAGRKVQFGRNRRHAGRQDTAVSRGHDIIAGNRRGSDRVTEK